MSLNLYDPDDTLIFSLEQELRAESVSLLYQVKRLHNLGFTAPQVRLRLSKQGVSRELSMTAKRLIDLWQSRSERQSPCT